MKKLLTLCYAVNILILASTSASAALVVNSPMAITHRVQVQPIIVSNTDGSNTAEYFGNATQQGIIEGFVDTIWAQAGIDVEFLTPNNWNDTFANIGNTSPRPTSDLNTIVSNGDALGFGNANPLVLDMYFVEISAGFANTSENTANGLAFVGGNGITQHVGDNLVSFTGGQEVVASVVSHEIGHNLGLPHIIEFENLMQPGGSANPGERLNATQISTALASQFSVAVPEPSSAALIGVTLGFAVLRRRRSSSSN